MRPSRATLPGPGGRPFTAEQADAIGRRDGALLLSANAGSGKTSVLVERFVASVLDDGVASGRILAITFTEKAAGELRARVRERFVELGERDAARETEAAWVSTIHGFCARVLRAHAVAAGLDPAFVVLGESAARELRAVAWDVAFARWLGGGDVAHPSPALDLAAAYGADRLGRAISTVHDALRSAGATRPALPAPVVDDPGDARARLDGAARALARELGDAGDGVQVGRARDAVDRCGELLAALAPSELAAAEDLVRVGFSGSAIALRSDACVAYHAAHADYENACRDVRAEDAVTHLDALLGHYADSYAEAKRTRSSLDFDDLELLTRDLLVQRPALRRTYAERFERVMVDEFQDSNPLQLELFELLDRDGVFVVGDENQSIYGFRHADVAVFRRRRDQLSAAGRVATLATNFRTRGAILDTINAAFAPRFGSGFVALSEGRQPAPEGACTPLVELLITDRDGWDDEGSPVDLGALPRSAAWRQAEARLLAQRVSDLVASGEARAEDVVVLVRAMGDLPVYERALEDRGLLTLALGGRGYWGRQVVRDLCAWLAALANPRDETALYGVLASPLVGLSSDALALIADAGPGNAWRAIDDGAIAGSLTRDDGERLRAFARRFTSERAMAPRLGLDELLARAVSASDYDLHVLGLPGGERRLANIHKLLRLAAEHERDHGRDVRGLADLATAELDADAREPDAPIEPGDVRAVRLMTIHAAKGLEFGVVCVADLGRRGSTEQPDLMVRDGRVGLRLVGLDGSSEKALDFVALRDRARAEAAAEEERIMYVALTRARDRLILSGGVDVGAWPAPGPGAPPLSWLGPALVPQLRDGLLTSRMPEHDVESELGGFRAHVRCVLNRPDTVGRVLRTESLAPAGADLPIAAPPPVRPPAPEPVAARVVERSLSYSALAAWRACGYRFYLTRVLGLVQERVEADPGARSAAISDPGRGDEAPVLDPRLRGTIVHELLEGEQLSGPSLAGSTVTSDEHVTDVAARHGAALDDHQLADVARLVTAFGASPLRDRMAAARHVRREHGFAFALADTLLTGVVDVLAEERDGTMLVVDYKTDGLEPGADLESLVAADYGVQRRVYALAALRAGARRVEVAYAFLERPREPVGAIFTSGDTVRLGEELLELAAGVLEGEYRVTDQPHRDLCATCPGRRALCSHTESETLRERPAALGGDPAARG